MNVLPQHRDPPKFKQPEDGLSFLQAAKRGDHKLLKSCIGEGVNIEIRPADLQVFFPEEVLGLNGQNALHLAFSSNHIEIIKELLRHGVNTEAKQTERNFSQRATAMERAALSGDVSLVSLLLNHALASGLEVKGDFLGMVYSLLQLRKTQFTKDHAEVIQIFLNHNLFPNSLRGQRNPLTIAVISGHRDAVEVLMKGFHPKSKLCPMLKLALDAPYVPIIELLIDYDVPVYPTLLKRAVEFRRTAIVHLLLPHVSAGVHHAVMMMMAYDDMDTLEFLLKEGNISDRAKQKSAVLFYSRFTEVTHLLLAYGFNPNAVDRLGRSALFVNVYTGLYERTKLLLDAGASVHILNNAGETPLFQLAQAVTCKGALNHDAVSEARRLFGENFVNGLPERTWRAFELQRQRGCPELDTMNLLLQAGMNPRQRSLQGNLAQHSFLQHDQGPVWGNLPNQAAFYALRLFAAYGADLSLTDSRGRSLLHRAALFADAPIVELLLEQGVEVDFENHGRTALTEAAFGAHGEYGYASEICMKMLIDAGADVKVRDEDGNTLLHRTIYTSTSRIAPRWEVFALLVERGVDPYEKNNAGETAMELFQRSGMPHMAAVLNQVLNGARDAVSFANLLEAL